MANQKDRRTRQELLVVIARLTTDGKEASEQIAALKEKVSTLHRGYGLLAAANADAIIGAYLNAEHTLVNELGALYRLIRSHGRGSDGWA